MQTRPVFEATMTEGHRERCGIATWRAVGFEGLAHVLAMYGEDVATVRQLREEEVAQ